MAAKAVKEVDYHRDHATQWVLRLGDGTAGVPCRGCRRRSTAVAPYVAELFEDDAASAAAAASGLAGAPVQRCGRPTTACVRDVVAEATLAVPEESPLARARRT